MIISKKELLASTTYILSIFGALTLLSLSIEVGVKIHISLLKIVVAWQEIIRPIAKFILENLFFFMDIKIDNWQADYISMAFISVACKKRMNVEFLKRDSRLLRLSKNKFKKSSNEKSKSFYKEQIKLRRSLLAFREREIFFHHIKHFFFWPLAILQYTLFFSDMYNGSHPGIGIPETKKFDFIEKSYNRKGIIRFFLTYIIFILILGVSFGLIFTELAISKIY